MPPRAVGRRRDPARAGGGCGFRAVPGILMDPLHLEFGWSHGTIGLAASVNMALFGLTSPFAAALMDRFGIRPVVTAALLMVAAGSGLTVFMTASWQLVLCWGVLVGLGTGSMALALVATVTGRWFVTHRGLVSGVLTAGGAAGQLIFLPLVAAVTETAGWRVASLGVAAAASRTSPTRALPVGAPGAARRSRSGPSCPDYDLDDRRACPALRHRPPGGARQRRLPGFPNDTAEAPERRSRYQLHLPYTILLRLGWGGEKGMVYFFASRPVNEDRRRLRHDRRNYDREQPDSVLQDFEDTIFQQDRRVVESQRPERVPFDLAAEMHLSSTPSRSTTARPCANRASRSGRMSLDAAIERSSCAAKPSAASARRSSTGRSRRGEGIPFGAGAGDADGRLGHAGA